MKLIGALVLLAVTGGLQAAEFNEIQSRPSAPSLELEDLSGQLHRLDELRGRVVLVNFWASWCPPCIREFPSLKQLREAMAGRPFEILAVNVAEPKGTVGRFASFEDTGVRVLMDPDGELTQAWEVEFYPTTFIIDPEGRQAYRVVGEAYWDGAVELGYIERLMPDSATRQASTTQPR